MKPCRLTGHLVEGQRFFLPLRRCPASFLLFVTSVVGSVESARRSLEGEFASAALAIDLGFGRERKAGGPACASDQTLTAVKETLLPHSTLR